LAEKIAEQMNLRGKAATKEDKRVSRKERKGLKKESDLSRRV
jgi:hypothetical protein